MRKVRVRLNGVRGFDRHRMSCVIETILHPMQINPSFDYGDGDLSVQVDEPIDTGVLSRISDEFAARGYPDVKTTISDKRSAA